MKLSASERGCRGSRQARTPQGRSPVPEWLGHSFRECLQGTWQVRGLQWARVPGWRTQFLGSGSQWSTQQS